MSDLRLIVFDVDGTLVDSQAEIVTAMTGAFQGQGLTPPDRSAILSIVGLSLDQAMHRLVPDLSQVLRDALVASYRQGYFDCRQSHGASPLYPGALATLQTLAADPWTLLGVATGKSQRGLDALIEAHDLGALFVTRQVADHHPSKPHPSMLLAALGETGVAARDAVMVGDTSFDIDMARAARVGAVGVGWGYHACAALAHADAVIETFGELPAALGRIRENR